MAKQSKKDFVKGILRAARISDSLEAKGVAFKHARKEDWSGVGFTANGYLGRHGDKIKVSYRYEVSGRTTYHLRDLLKGNGFRWDPREKVWHTKKAPKAFGEQLLRAIAERGLAV